MPARRQARSRGNLTGMYLGIDLGTSSLKAMLIDRDQHEVASAASSEIAVSRPRSGWSEQDPAAWIAACEEALGKLAASHGQEMQAVRGIGLSGHMHGATLLDAKDRPLRPCILWNDTRSHAEAAELDADPRFRAITGNIVFPGFTAPKLLWVQRNEPEIFAKTRKVLLPKDYLRLWLTGEHLSEMSDSAGTSWLDTGARRWSDDLLEATGLTQAQMPGLTEGTQVAGRLRADIGARFGLKGHVPVAGGAGDNAASAAGLGTVAEGRAFVSIGTSGVLFAANDGFKPLAQSAVHTFCHALPGSWHQMGVILSATDSLNWLARITGRKAGELTSALGEELRQPGGPIFHPYLSGERTPHNDAMVRGSFFGFGHEHGVPELTHAVLEGVAFAFADNLEALRTAGADVRSAFAVGGGSRSAYWLKLVATLLDMPVHLPVSGDFGAAFGAARLGLVAAEGADPLGVLTEPAIARSFEPDAGKREAYEQRLRRYQELYKLVREERQ
jgi:xylulokinase